MIQRPGSIPPLPISCLADFVTRGGRSPEGLLGPYKFRLGGEGQARITLRPPARNVILAYYKSGGDPNILVSGAEALRKKMSTAISRQARQRYVSNIVAIDGFRLHQPKRRYRVLAAHRISLSIGGITFRATPDLWVEDLDLGDQRLIRLGFGARKRSYIDTLLIATRQAALLNGYTVGANNVVYLHAPSGQELTSAIAYDDVTLTFAAAVRDIIEAWPRTTQLGPTPATSGRQPLHQKSVN